MATSYTITYNGYTLTKPMIDGWISEPVYADDGLTQVSTRHEMTGTAVLHGATDGVFNTDYTNARKGLAAPRGTLTIKVNDGNGDETLWSIAEGDEQDGPKGDFKITKVHGALTALISFRLEWHQYEPSSGSTQDVLAHCWSSKFAYDDVGRCTWTIAGVLHIKANASSTTATDYSTPSDYFVGSNPDAYRLTVTPGCPSGFRYKSSEFGVDESGNRLIYTVVYEEKARDLPYPARTGSGSFHYQASLSGGDIMGVKTFEVELTGPVNCSAADLLAAAVLASKNRIIYSNAQGGLTPDIIESISVEEVDIFEHVRVRYRVVARCVRDSDAMNGALGPPNISMLSDIMAGVDAGYTDITPYGSALIRQTRRALQSPTNTTIYHGQLDYLNDSAENDLPTSPNQADSYQQVDYTFPDRVFDTVQADLIPASGNQANTVSENHKNAPYVEMTMSERVEVISTGMLALGSMSKEGKHVAYQAHQPIVIYTSEQRMSRLAAPPERAFLKLPPGAVVLNQDFSPMTQRLDSNGNIIFSVSHRRTAQLLNTDAQANGFGVIETPGHVRFWPPNDGLHAPHDPRIDSVGGGSIFDIDTDRNLPTPTPEDYISQ